jgi:ribosomal protein S18 acetylase RimI-like enzyme
VCHILEIGGIPAAAVAAYAAAEVPGDTLRRATEIVDREIGSTQQEVEAGWQIAELLGRAHLEFATDAWALDNLATLPEWRRRGFSRQLMEKVLALGRARGSVRAELTILIGNTAAHRAYERLGFRVVEEKRDIEHERLLGSPGTARMVSEL